MDTSSSSSNLSLPLKRKQPNESEDSIDGVVQKSRRDLTLRELIPPTQFRKNNRLLQLNSSKSIFPSSHDQRHTSVGRIYEQCSNKDIQLDWTAVIARARSHPHEARESYFGRSDSTMLVGTSTVETDAGISTVRNYSSSDDKILVYKPLHAMLKYDPPLQAVEAVLRAHPSAALDVTFEGTALKIGAESKLSSASLLRLLLVAEMAMRKKQFISSQLKTNQIQRQLQLKKNEHLDIVRNGGNENEMENEHSRNEAFSTDANASVDDLESLSFNDLLSLGNVFIGHNPIRWIAEPQISRKTVSRLLKWYPIGAFQRPRDEDGASVNDSQNDFYDDDVIYAESPLVEIVDDFAGDQDTIEDEPEDNGVDYYESESEDELDSASIPGTFRSPRRQYTLAENEVLRKERRWEKFLHILYATDKVLMAMKPSSFTQQKPIRNTSKLCLYKSTPSPPTDTTKSKSKSSEETLGSSIPAFRPVHAWIRCITHPNLGLGLCRPYGVWSILRAMGQRIPSEFKTKDESDGYRTAFQTLAESPAINCRLCLGEIRLILEYLLEADYHSAYLPRRSDGKLIIHVALENGWPCRDSISRKLSATSA